MVPATGHTNSNWSGFFGTSPCCLFLRRLRVNCSWDKSLRDPSLRVNSSGDYSCRDKWRGLVPSCVPTFTGMRTHDILWKIGLFSIQNYSFIYTRLFENLKARILKRIITCSEMEQQTARAKKVNFGTFVEVLKLDLWKTPRLSTKIKFHLNFFVFPCMFFVVMTDKTNLTVVVNLESWRFTVSESQCKTQLGRVS